MNRQSATLASNRSLHFPAALTQRGSQLAFRVLRTAFVVAPIVFGIDKFTNLLAHWPKYLAPWIDSLVPGTAQQAMYAVGVIEIVAGLLVAWRPRIGGLVVSLWLLGIVVNLVSTGSFLDVALRDVGLLAGAVALTLLAGDRSPRTDTR